jgi:RNA polymerase sigma-70 factor (ECF subfamily)
VGQWVPEPLPDRTEWSHPVDPADRVTLDESVSMAFLVVLEAMTPAERVAFILHDVFCHSFAEVAEIVGRTPAACRKLASSARARVRASLATAAPATEHAALVKEFKQAWESKDIQALIALLDPAVTAIADGGGRISTVVRPVEGAEHVARYAVEIAGWIPGLTILECTVNGLPGLVAQSNGVTVTVMAFHVADGRIARIWGVRNPDKLRSWTVAPPP